MQEHLHPWFMQWLDAHADTNLIYAPSAKKQIMFVRDHLGPLVHANRTIDDLPEIEFDRSDGTKGYFRETAFVIGTHLSKSVPLPVYEFIRPDIGLRMTMRDNFYNWKISVDCETAVEADFGNMFYTVPPIEPEYTGNPLHPVYFEGFPEDRIFGYYSENPKQFSAEIWGTTHRMYAAVWLIMQALGQIKPLTWHTRESHAAELAARREQRMSQVSG